MYSNFTEKHHSDLHLTSVCLSPFCLQCFDAIGWAAGRTSGLRKTEWWGAGMVICLERSADLHMAQLMPLPLTVSCFNKIQIGFTCLVLAHPGSPGKRAVKWVCVCVCLNSASEVTTLWRYTNLFIIINRNVGQSLNKRDIGKKHHKQVQ